MKKLQKHTDLVALVQMPQVTLSVEDINELRLQLALRLQRELAAAREEAIRDLLDFSTEELAECDEAARAVVRAQWADGEDTTEEAEDVYFRQHPEVLELYLPRYLLGE